VCGVGGGVRGGGCVRSAPVVVMDRRVGSLVWVREILTTKAITKRSCRGGLNIR
jgi:hypothetical protein